jgi:hypothetical protein
MASVDPQRTVGISRAYVHDATKSYMSEVDLCRSRRCGQSRLRSALTAR